MTLEEKVNELTDMGYNYWRNGAGGSWIVLKSIQEYLTHYSDEFKESFEKEVDRIYKDYKENYEIVDVILERKEVKYKQLQRKPE